VCAAPREKARESGLFRLARYPDDACSGGAVRRRRRVISTYTSSPSDRSADIRPPVCRVRRNREEETTQQT